MSPTRRPRWPGVLPGCSSTMSRDAWSGLKASRASGQEPDWNPEDPMDDGNPLGEPGR